MKYFEYSPSQLEQKANELIEKHDKESIVNVKNLLSHVCGGRIFDFSTNHDTKLTLDE